MKSQNITSRQYRQLVDHTAIYDFMLEIYEPDWRNGVAAPFLEYALSSCWMNKEFLHRNRIWFDGDRIIGFCFTENPVTDTYFSLRPGYECIAEEMVRYAAENMPNTDNKQCLVLFQGQDALMKAAEMLGYAQFDEQGDRDFFFDKKLDYPLPEGFKFVEPDKIDIAKVSKCCYYGFDHEAEDGPWDGDCENVLQLLTAPHQTANMGVAIENKDGEYVCWAGMWWTPQNKLAYMEPLCTVPEYRRRGLAAAALTKHYQNLKPLGATHMTGGSDEFYEKIGFKVTNVWTFWKRKG